MEATWAITRTMVDVGTQTQQDQIMFQVFSERKQVQEEIERHYREIQRLNRHFNNLSPVNKIPPELLVEIFLILMRSQNHLAEDVEENRPNDIVARRHVWHHSMSWTAITGVCQQWREVALQTASLWSVIDPTCMEWARLLLERSQSVPLTLTGKSNVGVLNHVIREAAPRLSSVHLIFDPNNNFFAQASSQRTFPLLKNVSFKFPRAIRTWDFRRPESGAMPLVFEEWELPALQTLSLSGYELNPSSSMFTQSLTSLTIEHARRVAVVNLVEILSKTPMLSYLSLHGDIPALLSNPLLSPTTPERIISLPHLKYFSLAFTYELMGMVSLLNHLRFPSQATVMISLCPLDPDDPAVSVDLFVQGLMPTLLGLNRIGISLLKYRTCVLDLGDRRFDLWNEPYLASLTELTSNSHRIDAAKNPDTESGFFARMPSTINDGAFALAQDFLEIARRCPLRDIETVVIDDTYSPLHRSGNTVGWETVCSMMPNVSKVQIIRKHQTSRRYCRNLLSRILLLSPVAEASSPTEDEDADIHEATAPPTQAWPLVPVRPLPRLETLIITGENIGADWMEPLLEVLGERKTRGVAVERLIAARCSGMFAEDLERLRDVVEEVLQVDF